MRPAWVCRFSNRSRRITGVPAFEPSLHGGWLIGDTSARPEDSNRDAASDHDDNVCAVIGSPTRCLPA